jgi:hypothetical protein
LLPTSVGQGEQNAVVGCPERQQRGSDRSADEETISPALSYYTGGRQIEEMVNFSRFHRLFTKAKDSTGSINGHLVPYVPSSGTASDWIEFVELLFIPDLSPRTCDYLARIWVNVIFGQDSVMAIWAVHPHLGSADLRSRNV